LVTKAPLYRIVSPDQERQLFSQLPVTEVWGIGRRWAKRLEAGLKITSVEQLRQASPKLVRSHLSVIGERIVRELNGEPCLDLEEIQPNQQIICSKSFGQRIGALSLIQEAVANYAARACEKLRKRQLVARGLQVFLMTGHHDAQPYSNALSMAFPSPTVDSRRVIRLAKWLLARIYRPGYAYQKAGVMLLDLASAQQPTQRDLFVPEGDNHKLMRALDSINQSLGTDQLFFAAQGIQRPWKMRMAHRSPRYTTCWDELVRVT
jgi:DNA polymerase V